MTAATLTRTTGTQALTRIDAEVFACVGCGEPLTLTAPMNTASDAHHMFASFLSDATLVHPVPHLRDRAISRECEAHHPVCAGDHSNFVVECDSNVELYVRTDDGVPVHLIAREQYAPRMDALERLAHAYSRRSGEPVTTTLAYLDGTVRSVTPELWMGRWTGHVVITDHMNTYAALTA